MAYVYILESRNTGRYYIGSSKNVNERLKRHNSGMVPATKKFRPYWIVLVKENSTFQEARRIETGLKRLKRRDYLEKIVSSQKISLGH